MILIKGWKTLRWEEWKRERGGVERWGEGRVDVENREKQRGKKRAEKRRKSKRERKWEDNCIKISQKMWKKKKMERKKD